jgi:PAS domain S-box-containing protein
LKIRTNLFLINGIIITLAIAFSTLLLISHMRSEVSTAATAELISHYEELKFDILAGNGLLGIALLAVAWGIHRERNRSDRLLRESEQKYRALFESSAESLFLLDETLTYVDCNEQTSRLFGCDRAGIIGKSPLHFSPSVQPDGRHSTDAAREIFSAAHSGSPAFFPWQYRDCAGILIDTEVSLKEMVIEGRTVLQATVRDITERVRSEARLREMANQIRLITDSVPAGIAYIDAELRYRFANRHYEELIGHAGGEIVGRRVQDVVDAQFMSTVAENLRLALSGNSTTCMNRLARGDGSVICVQTTYVPDIGAEGMVVGLVIQHSDITEHMQLDAALRGQLTFHQTLIDTIPSPIFYKDRTGCYLGCNGAFERYLGLSRQELIGNTVYDIAPQDLADRYFEMDETLFANPGVQMYDASVVYADGSRHEVTFSKATFLDPDGRVAGLVGVILDLTERKRSERLLLGEKTVLEMIVNEAPLIDVLEQLCRNVESNVPGALCSVMLLDGSGIRLSHGTVPGLPAEDDPVVDKARDDGDGGRSDATAFVHKPGMNGDITIDPLWEKYRALPLRYGMQPSRSMPIRSTSGIDLGTFAVYHTDRKVADQAELHVVERAAHLASIVIDRHRAGRELRASEERFHQIFAQSDDAIILFRLDNLVIIDANPAAQELFGYGHSELVSRMPFTLIGQEDFAALIAAIPENDAATVFQLDRAAGLRSDGSRVMLVIRCRILQLRDEYVIHCSIRDITEKVRLEEEVRNTQARLIHTNKMTSIGMLASSVAHEINNPNNCISVNAAMLADIWQDAEPLLSRHHAAHGEFALRGIPFAQMRDIAPRLLNGITEGSRRITAIVDSMKDFVREDKSGLHGAIDINRLVRNAASILWHHIHVYTDRFDMNLQHPLPPARGNGQQIEQVIINLFMNALQALPDKQAAVRIATSCDPEAGTVTITVGDEGAGMDGSVLARLKEPFFTTKMAEGGTGLGLYISDSILREHRGSLEFDSAPGRGTTATVTLPLAVTSS